MELKCPVCMTVDETAEHPKKAAVIFEGMSLCKDHFKDRWQSILIGMNRPGNGGLEVPRR